VSPLTDDLRDAVHTLRVLAAIVEHGSFAAAAQRLGLTPSAVSKTIARAEARLGVRLLQRTTRRVGLTEAATEYLARGREILHELTALERDLVEASGSLRGRVRIAAPTVYGALAVAPVLARVQRAHPELRIELRCEDRRVDLVAEGVDLAVRFLEKPPLEMVATWLHDDERGLFAGPGYPAPDTPEALPGHALLRYGSEAGPTSVFWSDNVLAVREAARAGAGIAELPRYLAAEDVARGTLIEVLPGTLSSQRSVWLVHLPARLPRRVRVVREALIGALACRQEGS
jgi:DNA-binding transcriptional LysR family regulator